MTLLLQKTHPLEKVRSLFGTEVVGAIGFKRHLKSALQQRKQNPHSQNLDVVQRGSSLSLENPNTKRS